MANKHTISDLYQMQSLPLSAKIRMTEYRIRQWYEEYDGEVYVSFSGGKDSTVLLHIARNLYHDMEALFINTGLEYPAIRKFALSKENVTEIRPKMAFRDVIVKYGYPVISKEIASKAEEVKNSIRNGNTNTVRYRQFMGLELKDNGQPSEYNCERYNFLLKTPFRVSDKCCDVMKKRTVAKYEKRQNKKPIIAAMTDESRQRRKKWIQFGCNAFEMKHPQSNPMSFWTENDVLEYIYENQLQIAEPYGNVAIDDKTGKFYTTGCKRTGCIFCLFGIRQDTDRIARLQVKEPKIADYVLRGGRI